MADAEKGWIRRPTIYATATRRRETRRLSPRRRERTGGLASAKPPLASTTRVMRRPRAGETVKGEVVQPAAVAGTVVTQPGSGVPPGCAPGGHCRRLCGNHRSPHHRRDTVDPQGRRTSTAASSPGSSASSAAGASSAARATRAKSTTRPTARRSWRRERRAASSSLRGNQPRRRVDGVRAPEIYSKQVRGDVLSRSSLDVTVVSNAVDPSKVDKLT